MNETYVKKTLDEVVEIEKKCREITRRLLESIDSDVQTDKDLEETLMKLINSSFSFREMARGVMEQVVEKTGNKRWRGVLKNLVCEDIFS